MIWQQTDTVYVTTAKDEINRELVFEYLHHTAYWSKGIPKSTCMASLDNSLTFSLVVDTQFAGFARLVTDMATFAYLADVFVLEDYRGSGYGKFLVQCINGWIEDKGIRTALLLTRDAQGLYEQYGWVNFADPSRVMRYKKQQENFYDA